MRLSPGREGTWFSIVGDTSALASPPSQGGTRGVFSILPTAPGPPQDPPCPSLRGRGSGFCRSATRQPSRLPPHRGEQGGSFLFCPLRPCHRKTLPVPPFEGGDLVSVGQQHDSPRVSPLIGGNKGGLSLEEPAKGRSSRVRDQEKTSSTTSRPEDDARSSPQSRKGQHPHPR